MQMRVEQIMSHPPVTCTQDDSLSTAARLMWDRDCGVLPVIGDDGAVVGMLTDRDICMASLTQGRPLHAITVTSAMAKLVYCIHPQESIDAARHVMSEEKVRRLPVVDGQGQPVGVLSLNDIARHDAASGRENGAERALTQSLAAIGEPRTHGVRPRSMPAKVIPLTRGNSLSARCVAWSRAGRADENA